MERLSLARVKKTLSDIAISVDPVNAAQVATIIMTEPLSRRDFLKVAGMAIGAAEVPSILQSKEKQQTIPPAIITESDPAVTEEFISVLKKEGVVVPEASTFKISIGGTSWNFLTIPPLTDDGGNTQDEKLYMREVTPKSFLHGEQVKYTELVKNTEKATDGTPIVMWQSKFFLPRPNKKTDFRFEKVLWYPDLTKDQWLNLTQEELDTKYRFLAFSPSSRTDYLVDGYNRDSEQSFALDINKTPEHAKKALIRKESIAAGAPIPDTLKTFNEKVGQAGYKLGWNKENTAVVLKTKDGVEVPEFKIDPANPEEVIRAYKLPKIEQDYVVKVKLSDIEINQDSIGVLNWELVEGKWQRKTVEFPTKIEGETVKLKPESVDELRFEIIKNSSSNPRDRINDQPTALKMLNRWFTANFDKGRKYYTYGGMYETSYDGSYWRHNNISTTDTATYIIIPLSKERGQYWLVGWVNSMGFSEIRLVDKGVLNKPSDFSQ